MREACAQVHVDEVNVRACVLRQCVLLGVSCPSRLCVAGHAKRIVQRIWSICLKETCHGLYTREYSLPCQGSGLSVGYLLDPILLMSISKILNRVHR